MLKLEASPEGSPHSTWVPRPRLGFRSEFLKVVVVVFMKHGFVGAGFTEILQE